MPTALELTREELQVYVDAHRKRVWPTLTAEQEAEREAKIELARQEWEETFNAVDEISPPRITIGIGPSIS